MSVEANRIFKILIPKLKTDSKSRLMQHSLLIEGIHQNLYNRGIDILQKQAFSHFIKQCRDTIEQEIDYTLQKIKESFFKYSPKINSKDRKRISDIIESVAPISEILFYFEGIAEREGRPELQSLVDKLKVEVVSFRIQSINMALLDVEQLMMDLDKKQIVKTSLKGSVPRSGDYLKTALGEYEIINKVDEGANSFIFKVRQTQVFYAAKVLKVSSTTSKRNRFQNEINTMRKLSHSHVAKIIDWGTHVLEQHTLSFYIMELFESNLEPLINSFETGNYRLRLFLQVLNAISYCHANDIVHRDLKPENILYKEGICVIADFGIAKIPEEFQVVNVQTISNEILANRIYYAPEQYEKDANVDNRADIFALGMILYKLFIKSNMRGSNNERVGDFFPEMSFLDAIIYKMTSKKPEDRFQSIQEIEKEIGMYFVDETNGSKNHINSLDTRIVNVPAFPEGLQPFLYPKVFRGNVAALIRHLNMQSTLGLANDPNSTLSELDEALKLEEVEIDLAVDELLEYDIVKLDSLIDGGTRQSRVRVNDALFWYSDPDCQQNIPWKDAMLIIKTALEIKRKSYSSLNIMNKLSWNRRRFNPALSFMLSRSLVLGSHAGDDFVTTGFIVLKKGERYGRSHS